MNLAMERGAALRRAFDTTMKEPEFLSEAERQLMEITPMAGHELAQLVTYIAMRRPRSSGKCGGRCGKAILADCDDLSGSHEEGESRKTRAM